MRGSADIKSNNGSVTLNDLGGAAKVRASFGSVFIDGVGGSVDIPNSTHELQLDQSGPAGRRPDGVGYAVNARTYFGRVSTDIPILTTGVTEGTLTGTIGKGGCKLDLVNANVNITIEKE